MSAKKKKTMGAPAAAPTSTPAPARRHAFGFGWWVKSGLIAAAVVLLLPRVLRLNAGYEWLLDRYAKVNLEFIKDYGDATYDQRMLSKLGNDYAFILYLKQKTPVNAVLLYPDRAWLTDSLAGQPSMFNGNLCDKLSAVRFLYPRRVVIPQEMGHTSWGRRLTHVAVVGRHGSEYLTYTLPPDFMIGVMPVKLDSAAIFGAQATAPVEPQTTPQP